MENKSKPSRHSKHYARCCAVQALYQWHHTQHTPAELIEQFVEGEHLKQADKKYFKKLVNGVVQEQLQLDTLFSSYLDRPLTDLNPVECAILRVSVYELVHHLELPYKVIINEAVEITKEFGAEESYKYINAILDALAPKVRKHEYSHRA